MDRARNRGRWVRAAGALSFLSLGLAACGDRWTPTALEPPVLETPPPQSGRALGVVEITLSGLADGTVQASAISAPSVAALELLRGDNALRGGGPASQAMNPPALDGGGGNGTIQLSRLSTGSFTDGEPGEDGVRYIHATFRVRNAQADGTPYDTPRQNLTFLAIDTDGTIGVTPFAQFRRFDGSNADPMIAMTILPTGAVTRDLYGSVVAQGPDVLQVLTEDEAAAVPRPAGVNDVFPYGFVTRRASSTATRTLPASPDADTFDGLVTFAFEVPLQESATDDPYTISIVVLALDDSETRITQSLEEQDSVAQAAFVARANDLGASVLTVLPGSTLSGPGIRKICTVRTAGTAASPMAFLVVDLCGFSLWTGEIDTNWHLAGNWFPAAVPTEVDTVVVTEVDIQPTLTAAATVGAIFVDEAAIVDLGSYALTSYGAVMVFPDGQITNGNLVLMGNGSTLLGDVPSVRVTAGYTVAGAVTVRGALSVSDGSLSTFGAPISIQKP